MGIIDDQLTEINQELEDMAFAEQQAKEKGLTLGDYDLQSATQARSRDRIKEESQDVLSEGKASVVTPPEGEMVVDEEKRLPTDNPYILPMAYEKAIKPEHQEREYQGKGEFIYDTAKHKDYLSKFKGYQEKLTDKLIEENPSFKEFYEKGRTLDAEGRAALFNEMKKKGHDFYLSPEEQEEVLGSEALKDYQDLKYVLTFSEKERFGTTTVGTKEKAGDPLEKFGSQSALLYQYEGAPRTTEARKKDVEFLRKKSGADTF